MKSQLLLPLMVLALLTACQKFPIDKNPVHRAPDGNTYRLIEPAKQHGRGLSSIALYEKIGPSTNNVEFLHQRLADGTMVPLNQWPVDTYHILYK